MRMLLRASLGAIKPSGSIRGQLFSRNMVAVAQQPVLDAAHLLPESPSRWKRVTDVPLTRENFLDLLHGRTPLIKEPNFLTHDQCRQYEHLISRQLMPYKHNTGPLLTKYGVAQFEYQAQSAINFLERSDEKAQYFADASQYLNLHAELAQAGMDAWARVFNKIKGMFPEWDVEIASEDNNRQRYFSGIFRALNDATHLHCDWSPYDSLTEDWILNQVESQVVYNLYLAPVIGGRTIVYDVQWNEEALAFRDPESYGYHRDIVKGVDRAYVVPEPGALCFFNSRNMHEVETVEKEPMPELGLAYRPRLTLSSFMGLIPAAKTGTKPKLIFWS